MRFPAEKIFCNRIEVGSERLYLANLELFHAGAIVKAGSHRARRFEAQWENVPSGKFIRRHIDFQVRNVPIGCFARVGRLHVTHSLNRPSGEGA